MRWIEDWREHLLATIAMERGVDALADRLGLDPAKVRRRNLVCADQMPYENVTGRGSYDSGDYPEALRRALAQVGWEGRRAEHAALRARGVLRGVGVAFGVESTSVNSQALARAGRREAGYESTAIPISPQGAITLACGLMPSGPGPRDCTSADLRH